MKRCPRCKRNTLRMKVNLFLDIDASLTHQLSKRALRSRLVRVEGAGWDRSLTYCTRCPYLLWLTG